VRWDNLVDKVVVGPNMIKEMEEKIAKIKKILKASPDMKKIYDDKGRTHR
jgi:adenine-specific DNA methylase